MQLSPQVIHKCLLGFLGVSLFAVVVAFTLLGVKTWGEYEGFREREFALKQEIVQAQAERSHKKAYLQKLLTDPKFFERVARERLGYSRDGELIIRFEDE